jgi:SAM-dependent methyltransferase
MTARSFGSDGWQKVDASQVGADMRAYLDGVAATTEPQRKLSFELLALEPGMTVLDAGCGSGAAALELAALVGPSGRVIAADFSEEMVAATAQRATAHPNIVVTREDVRRLRLEDGSVDSARCERVLMHLSPEDADTAVAELVRVTANGGRVVVVEPAFAQSVFIGAEELFGAVARTIANPLAGLRIPKALIGAGCSDVAVHVVAFALFSLAEVSALFPMNLLAESAVAGGMPRARAEELIAACQRADAAGEVAATEVFYVVGGTVSRQ